MKSSNKDNALHAETPMLSALRDDTDGCGPRFFRGNELEVEFGDYSASLNNIRTILKAGCRVVSILANAGKILFIFATGEQYLATGFTIGQKTVNTFALAEIAAESIGGDVDDWRRHLTGLPEDWEGPLELPPIFNRELAVVGDYDD